MAITQEAVGHRRFFSNSETKDWGSVADGANATEDVTVEGAVLGDFALASMSIDIDNGVILSAHVSAANTVTVTLHNESGGAVDLASATLSVLVISNP